MDPNDKHPYQFGIDALVAGAGVTPDEAWSTEVVARHAEEVTKGLTIVHKGRAEAKCNQLRWDGAICSWSKWLEGRTDMLSRRARAAIAEHLRAEHAYIGDEGIRLRVRRTTDTLHDWSPGVRQYTND